MPSTIVAPSESAVGRSIEGEELRPGRHNGSLTSQLASFTIEAAIAKRKRHDENSAYARPPSRSTSEIDLHGLTGLIRQG